MLISLKNTSDYKLKFESQAEKYLKKLVIKDKKTASIILKAIREILNDPYNSDMMKGNKKGVRKKKQGDYRILFKINNNVNPAEIRIYIVGHRKNVYK